MPEGVVEYEHDRNVFYRVEWKSKIKDGLSVTSLIRRAIESAMELAQDQRRRGFKVKLIRVEETELDF